MDAGGQHEWGELVQLDPQTVGVIVRLERETFQVGGVRTVSWQGAWARLSHVTCSQVLNMHGKVLTVRHQAVNRRKDNHFAVALDSEQNNIHVKDIVKVIDGPHSVSASLSHFLFPAASLPAHSPPPPSSRAVRGRSATSSGASPSSTVKSWWRTAACLFARRATWC